jgi:hypothetical protein
LWNYCDDLSVIRRDYSCDMSSRACPQFMQRVRRHTTLVYDIPEASTPPNSMVRMLW